MRTATILLPLLLLALPWNSCSKNRGLSNNGQSHLRSGAGFFNPQAEIKSTSKKTVDD